MLGVGGNNSLFVPKRLPAYSFLMSKINELKEREMNHCHRCGCNYYETWCPYCKPDNKTLQSRLDKSREMIARLNARVTELEKKSKKNLYAQDEYEIRCFVNGKWLYTFKQQDLVEFKKHIYCTPSKDDKVLYSFGKGNW